MSPMLRVTPETRDRVTRVAAEDFGGVTADTAIQRLLNEHWEYRALVAAERVRAEDPARYAEDAAELDAVDAAGPDDLDE
jgi:hypothetical protein